MSWAACALRRTASLSTEATDCARPGKLFGCLNLSAIDKKAVWLMEVDGEVLWVPGCKVVRAFTVEPGSTDYVLLQYNTI